MTHQRAIMESSPQPFNCSWFSYFKKYLPNDIFICGFQYLLHLNNTQFNQALWCVIYFTLDIVHVVYYISSWNCGTPPFWVTLSEVLPYMVSTSAFFLFPLFFFFGCAYEFQLQNINRGQPTPQIMYPYMTPQTPQIFIIEGYLISNM